MLSRKIINLNYMGSNWSNKAHSTKYEVVLSQSKCLYDYLMVHQLS